jgi:mannonate dehydratase
VIKIAEVLPPQAAHTPLWSLMRQAGVQHAVGTFYQDDALFPAEKPWHYLPLLRLKDQYERAGYALDVLEARPPLNKAKRGQPGRDEEIAEVVVLLESMGRLGIQTWCYEWMTDLNWLRTATAIPSRGGSFVSGYEHEKMELAGPTAEGPVSEELLWETLEYFLSKVLPAAERVGVQLAMHPDDPPLSPIRGVGRIMSSLENYQRLLDQYPSPMNGITLCQGNFGLMTKDLPAAIRHFGRQGKIFFVHFRDVVGEKTNFQETWHDAGPTDLYECMRAYREVGFSGVLRPDHVPTLDGEPNDRPGYGVLGRLFAVGYIRGLQEGAYHQELVAAAASGARVDR